MKKRSYLILLLFIGLISLTASAQHEKPNVIIIMSDQLRYDVISEKYTPNITKLMDEGVVFNRAYTASPLCVPSRGSFFTGNYPNETHSILNGWEPQDKKYQDVKSDMPNLYQSMENDWDSWHTGKQHFFTKDRLEDEPETKTKWSIVPRDYMEFLSSHNVTEPGGGDFKAYTPEEVSGKYTTLKKYSIPTTGVYEPGYDYFFDGWIKNESIKAIKNRDKSKPFLLNAMFLAPHPPFQVPEPYFSMYQDEAVVIPQNVGRLSVNQSPLQAYNLTGFLGYRYSREDWTKVWPVYLGLTHLMDYSVGEIIKELKAQNMYDNSLIIFTADHGEMLGSHKLWQKMCMYEESVKTPLIIKFPKNYQPKVKSVNHLVSNIDVFPTIFDYLNVPLAKPVSGKSLMPLVKGESFDRNKIFIQYDGNGARGNFQRAVLKGDYKLIVDKFKNELFLELYDVVNDPQELKNLAFEAKNEVLIENMLKELRKHMNTTNDLIEIEGRAYVDFIKNYKSFSSK